MPQPRLRRYLRHGTLPQLAVFEASARTLCFTRAAEELHLAQPTVSAQMRKLTESVGAPLFELVGKRMRLTEAGRRTYDHCREIFGVLGRLDDALAELRDMKSSGLRLSVCGASSRYVTRLLAGFCREHPGVSIAVRVDNHAALRARLARRDDDLYLVAQVPDDVPVVRQAILANPLVAVAPADDPLCRDRAIALSRLAEAPFVMREPGSATRTSVVELFARAGLSPGVCMELPSDEAIRGAVAAGGGVSVLPRHTFGEPHRGVREIDVAGLPLERHWHLAYAVGASLTRSAQAFVRYVRDDCPAQRSGAQKAVGRVPAPYPS